MEWLKAVFRPTRQNLGMWLGAIGVVYACEYVWAVWHIDEKEFKDRKEWNAKILAKEKK